MESFSRVVHWSKTLTIKNWFNYYKSLLCLSCIIYGLYFGFTTGILTLVTCLLFCKLPMLIVHINDLQVKSIQPQVLNNVQPNLSSKNVAHEPYFLIKNDNITEAVNDPLEKFLNDILDKFVVKWQGSFKTREEHFVIELRHTMKYIIIRLYKLIQEVDISKLLIEKVVPLALWHLDCFSTGISSKIDKNLEKNVLSCFGKNLHHAVESRKVEELYLRHYSERLLDYLLPPQLKQSKLLTILLRDILSCQIFQNAMDALADPDNINQLIIIMLDPKSATLCDQETLPVTPILDNFTAFTGVKPEPLIYPSFSSILKTPPHLYHLMQFLKRENSLKYLQFCFAVDEFNEKLLNPDLKDEQLERLQLTGRKLFEIFFIRNSPDCIQFGTESESRMKTIVYGNVDDIVQLRTCPTLFEAYDHVMDTLENKILTRFYRSEEFYQLVRDMQHAGGFSKNTRKKSESGASGWSKKIRSAIRPAGWLSVEAGRLPASNSSEFEEITYDTGVDLTEADFIPDELDEPECPSSYSELIPICGRDLTAWRAAIPRVVSAIDSSGKSIWAFEVDVLRVDLRPEDDPDEYHWTVIRTYAEFYNLEAKLTEFHGEFLSDIRLPAKKMFGTRSFEFLESLRLEFEWYLKSLLQQSALKGSDLIFSFLTLSQLSAACQTVADGISSNILPDLGLGRMMRTVPLKLRKERGQHLDHFLQSFVASTEAPKSRPSKAEGRDFNTNEVSVPVVKDLHPIYQNNARTFLSGPMIGRNTVNPLKLDGPFEWLLFIAWKIWKIPQTWWCALVGVGSFLRDFVDVYTHRYVNSLLARALHPQKIALSIELLHETVLGEESKTDCSESEKKKRAWNCIVESLPQLMRDTSVFTWMEDQCLMVFRCLQHPVLNKQLSYILFETALREICPEIFEDDEQ